MKKMFKVAITDTLIEYFNGDRYEIDPEGFVNIYDHTRKVATVPTGYRWIKEVDQDI